MPPYLPVVNNPNTGAFPGGAFAPSTPDGVGLVDEMNGYAWVTPNHFSLDFTLANVGGILSAVADPGAEGGATNWQMSFRTNTAGDFIVGVDPMGLITGVAAIDSPPLNASPAFQESSIPVAQIGSNWGANSVFSMVQVDNAIWVWVTNDNATPTFYVDSFNVGKLYIPQAPNLSASIVSGTAGRMGLGMLTGLPINPTTTGVANSMWGSLSNSRVLNSITFDAGGLATSAEWWRPGAQSSGPINSNLGAIEIPVSFEMVAGSSTPSSSTLGMMPYWKYWHSSLNVMERVPVSGPNRQCWLSMKDSASTVNRSLVPWDENVGPR